MQSRSPLRMLVDLISSSVDAIEAQYSESKLDFPLLDNPIDPDDPRETLLYRPEIVQASALITSACEQLVATCQQPFVSVFSSAAAFHLSSCLGAALKSNTVEILREAGPQGLHVKDIAVKNGMDASILARILRLLATHHVFREVRPDVFTNNRLSSVVDTQKASAELFAKPAEKFDGTDGKLAITEHTIDVVFKSSAYMTDNLLDPVTGKSEEVAHAAFNRAFGIEKNYWDWLELPDNKDRKTRFGIAMESFSRSEPPNAVSAGFEWHALPKQSLVVDVGGGIGATSLKIARAVPDLRFIVEDRADTIVQGEDFWRSGLPDALEAGTVQFKEHNFFSPQPVEAPAVFLLRWILHDWPRKDCIQILRHLREAAGPDTKLVINDMLLAYACLTDDDKLTRSIPGANIMPPIPPPLLPNLGKASATPYLFDFQMHVMFNTSERNIGAFVDLATESGWKITKVHSIPGALLRQIVAVPA